MKFLVDANLPPGLASWLGAFGHQAIHVMDVVGLRNDDRAIFDYARLHNLTIMTKDEDFALLTTLSPDSPSVVWLRLGNATNPALRALAGPDSARTCAASGGGRKAYRGCVIC
jgi:predicted nuclease of predicted toxin-antitoxin system